MTASFIPVFTTWMREKSQKEVWDFANQLFWTLALVAAVITVLGIVFSPSVVKAFTFSASRHGLDAGGRAEPDHFPLHLFHFAGGAGDGDFELFSHFRIASGDARASESGNHSVFDGVRLALLPQAGDCACGRSAGGRGVAIFGASANAGAEGNEVRFWNFVFAPGNSQRGAV